MVVSRRESQWRESRAGVRAIAEWLPLAAAAGAPEVGSPYLQSDGAGALGGDGRIGHPGGPNASGLKLLIDTMTSHMLSQGLLPIGEEPHRDGARGIESR